MTEAEPGAAPRAEPRTSLSDPVTGDPESVPVAESESETLSGVGFKSSAAEALAARRHQAGATHPDDNVAVISALVHETIKEFGDTEDLTELVKRACATKDIAYTSGVVAKAIDSVRAIRHKRVSQ